jgi:hypothetical protein
LTSVIALMERREARAREELDVLLEALRGAQKRAEAGRERLEHARIAREELLLALAEEAEARSGPPAGGAVPGGATAAVDASVVPEPPVVRVVPVREGYDPRPPVWCEGLDEDALSGRYREIFLIVAASAGPVSAQELTAALGQDASRMNEVEKTRHRAYALTARGWLVRERGVFTPASGPAGAGATRASESVVGPGGGSA